MPDGQTAVERGSPVPDRQSAVVDLYAGYGLRLDEAVPLALAAESAGFGGLWTLEAHTELFLPLVLAAEHTSGSSWARPSGGRLGGPGSLPARQPAWLWARSWAGCCVWSSRGSRSGVASRRRPAIAIPVRGR
jgi:hypothetical protein